MSYGTNAPQGLQPWSMLGGSAWNQKTNTYFIPSGYATSLFMGDPVVTVTTGTIQIASTGSNPLVGVFWGCLYQDTFGNWVYSKYWPGGTVTWNPGGTGNVNATAYVIDDPNVIFNIQANTTIAQTDLGSNFTFATGTGNTGSGQSAYSLNISTGATTPALNLKLYALTPFVNNSFGLTYNNGLVLINNHQYKGGTGTAGV